MLNPKFSFSLAPSTSYPTQRESGLGSVDYEAVKQTLHKPIPKIRYGMFTSEERFAIGKYASIHGPIAAVRKFAKTHPHLKLKESTARSFCAKYHQLIKSADTIIFPTNKIVTLKCGRPLLLGKLDETVKNFLIALRKKGGVVNTVVANATAKALISKSDNEYLQLIDLDSSSWAKSLFKRMGFVKRACTTSRPDIPASARKEAELIFHHQITTLKEKHQIPSSLIINIDQTPSKYAPL